MFKRFPYNICAALFAFVNFASAGVRLISCDDHSAVIEYQSGEPKFSNAGTEFQSMRLDEAQVFGRPGEPGLLECLAHLAVPEGALVHAEVMSAESKEYPGIKLAPVPSLAADKDGLDRWVYEADKRAYAAAGFLPSELARVESVEPLRQLTVARISIRPLQYAPASGMLRVYPKMRIRVTWSSGSPGGGTVNDKAFEPVLERLIINYKTASTWAKREEPKAGALSNPFGASQLWYKLSVAKDGIYKLSYTDLKLNGINPDIVDPRTIKIFTGGSRAFPKSHADPYPDSMYQVALRVEGEADGGFGPDDYILFYGRGMNGWNQNRRLPNNQYNNPYDSVNCYWLCWGGDHGLRMSVRNGEPVSTAAAIPADFLDTLHFEQDIINPFNSGELWYWMNMTRLNYEQTRRYSLQFFVPSVASARATVKVNLLAGTVADSNHHLRWGINGNTGKDLIWSGFPTAGPRTDQASVSGLVNGANSFDLELVKQGSDSADAMFVNWFEVVYRRPYQAFNRQLRFRGDWAYAGVIKYRMTGLSSAQIAILDISDPDRPVWISTSRAYPAYVEFEDQGPEKTYFAAAPDVWLTPLAVRSYQPQRLRQTMLGAKYLLIAADEFWPQAQVLLDYHKTKAKWRPAQAVKLSWIYDEFGFGLKDPSAVRNFLKYVYLNSAPARTSPAWCCLLGDGSYDYRWIDRNVPNQNLVPTHQEDDIKYVLEEYLCSANDDWFAYVDSSSYPQFVIGRIPAKNGAEAWTAVNKAVNYDAGKSLGPWRNRFLLMADDAFKKETPTGESEHTNYSEGLSSSYIPAAYDQLKVYG
ncbi:MAG: C25 family cysteine peptidase, partial [Candidatus Edwardsbacteria bacterium]|nr:C25 family cysteine peptidase [Candidatus Edwardsbacteria bacterium]